MSHDSSGGIGRLRRSGSALGGSGGALGGPGGALGRLSMSIFEKINEKHVTYPLWLNVIFAGRERGLENRW